MDGAMKTDLSKSVSVHLPHRAAVKLDVLCSKRGISKSAYVRDVLVAALKKERVKITLYDLMKDCLGCFDSGKNDISTNPKYMKGFGRSRRDGLSRKR
jgi:predicted DNA-binding protein